jgi:glucose/arabinose dehydrogenase
VLQGLAFPASFVFAPDGRLFFSERLTGRVRVVKEGVLLPEPLLSVPVVTLAETGLLGLALHPDFAAQPYLYAYYTYRDGHGRIWNRVSRWRDMDGRAGAEEVLLDHIPAASIHNGGAIAFGPDGKLYIPTGDAAQAALAQERLALNGKVLRMAPDGSVPEDNPFPGSLVFTLGHRNMFGLAFHPLTGVPYITENGTTRDDEINRLLPGRNYGWPTVLGKAGDAQFVDPLLTFTPNIAPTGLAFYTGGSLPGEIANSLFFGAFNTGMLYRVLLKGPDFLEVERFEPVLRTGTGGIIDVVMGPDGFLYFSTPSGIFRVVASP